MKAEAFTDEHDARATLHAVGEHLAAVGIRPAVAGDFIKRILN